MRRLVKMVATPAIVTGIALVLVGRFDPAPGTLPVMIALLGGSYLAIGALLKYLSKRPVVIVTERGLLLPGRGDDAIVPWSKMASADLVKAMVPVPIAFVRDSTGSGLIGFFAPVERRELFLQLLSKNLGPDHQVVEQLSSFV